MEAARCEMAGAGLPWCEDFRGERSDERTVDGLFIVSGADRDATELLVGSGVSLFFLFSHSIPENIEYDQTNLASPYTLTPRTCVSFPFRWFARMTIRM